jgi:N6-L-threonylcarbamoyladenine synthase
MIDKDNLDWSFSGLKTAVLNKIKNASLSKKEVPRYSAEVQEAIVEVLVYKTIKAAKKYNPKSILLAGGVAANTRLRERFQLEIRNSKLEIDLFIPPPKLCTDNAAYIASCAYYNNNPTNWSQVSSNPQLSIMGED